MCTAEGRAPPAAVQHGLGSITKLPHQAKSQRAAGTDTNLTSAETHYQVSNEGIFCLSRAVTHHHTPAVGLGELAAGREQEMRLTPCPCAPQPLLWWQCQVAAFLALARQNCPLARARITQQGGDRELLSHVLRLWEVVQCAPVTSRSQKYKFTCQYPLSVNNILVNNCYPFTGAPSTDLFP